MNGMPKSLEESLKQINNVITEAVKKIAEEIDESSDKKSMTEAALAMAILVDYVDNFWDQLVEECDCESCIDVQHLKEFRVRIESLVNHARRTMEILKKETKTDKKLSAWKFWN